MSGLKEGEEEERYNHMIFVTLKENVLLVHKTIVPVKVYEWIGRRGRRGTLHQLKEAN